jgi:hypothetical protein
MDPVIIARLYSSLFRKTSESTIRIADKGAAAAIDKPKTMNFFKTNSPYIPKFPTSSSKDTIIQILSHYMSKLTGRKDGYAGPFKRLGVSRGPETIKETFPMFHLSPVSYIKRGHFWINCYLSLFYSSNNSSSCLSLVSSSFMYKDPI